MHHKLLFLIVTVGLLSGCTSTASSPRPTPILPPQENTGPNEWGIVNITGQIDAMNDYRGNLTVGIASWNFSAPDKWVARADYEDFLGAHKSSLHARVLLTGGILTNVSQYASVDDAQADENAITRVSTDFSHTFDSLTVQLANGTHAVRIHIGDGAGDVVDDLATNRLFEHEKASWALLPAGERPWFVSRSVHVLVEDGCVDAVATPGVYRMTCDGVSSLGASRNA